MRDIVEVIEQLRPYIVAENDNYEHSLDNIIHSASYTAPEAMESRWAQVAVIVNSITGGHPFDSANMNKANIIAIFCDIPLEVAIERHGSK